MKRLISALLVAILFVTCLSTVAFAATVVKTGETKTFTVTVSGDEFCSYGIQLSTDPGIQIVSIDGVTANVGTGKVGFASDSNVTSHSFSVTVQITAENIGVYNVYASVLKASKKVDAAQDNADGIVDGLIKASVSANGASFEIVCNHKWDKGVEDPKATCTEDGVITYTCELCGETKTETKAALGHNLKTSETYECKDHDYHIHTVTKTCTRCDYKTTDSEDEIHTLEVYEFKAPTAEESGYKKEKCDFCGYQRYTEFEPNTPPPTGDITTVLSTGAAAIFVSMMSVVALVVKRKAI